VEWTFESSGAVQAHVEVPAGSVDVDPSTDGLVLVRLESDSVELLESATVTMTDNRLEIRVRARHFLSGVGGEVRCTVSLPEGSSLSYRTGSADLRCPIPLAEFDGKTASGEVTIGDVRADASLTSASGDFHCGDVGGRLAVKTASGDITVGRVGAEIQVSMASGDIDIVEAAQSMSVSTASGDVRVRCARSGRLKANSASGDIDIGVAPGVGAYLDVTSVSGDMECSLPVRAERPGAAQLEIICRTVSGDVRILAAA
jgi:hypothetical protein